MIGLTGSCTHACQLYSTHVPELEMLLIQMLIIWMA